jgi:cytochrome P450
LERLNSKSIAGTVEEILRYDPPLHMFTRFAYEDMDFGEHIFKRGDEVALMLGAAGRDPKVWDNPESFIPERPIKINSAFGGGIHFCVGAPLARLELQIAIKVLFERCPNIKLAVEPKYADLYHFHGLKELMVTT